MTAPAPIPAEAEFVASFEEAQLTARPRVHGNELSLQWRFVAHDRNHHVVLRLEDETNVGPIYEPMDVPAVENAVQLLSKSVAERIETAFSQSIVASDPAQRH
jgi:hypothetical protein